MCIHGIWNMQPLSPPTKGTDYFSDFLRIIHSALASGFGLEQDIPPLVQWAFVLKVQNLPEAFLGAVALKPVCVVCFLLSPTLPSLRETCRKTSCIWLVARVRRWETMMQSTELCHRRRKERWQQGNGEAAPASLRGGSQRGSCAGGPGIGLLCVRCGYLNLDRSLQEGFINLNLFLCRWHVHFGEAQRLLWWHKPAIFPLIPDVSMCCDTYQSP